MTKHSFAITITAAAALAVMVTAPRFAEAQPTAMCVRRASGVPGDSGAPKPWFPFGGGATEPPGSPDDPRWVGASGHSVAEQGAAVAPVELRSTWATESGQTYLYLSWQFFYTTGLANTAHVLHVAFTQPGAGLDDASARVVRFRFRGDSMTEPATYCANPYGFGTLCLDGTTSGVYTQFKRRMDTLPDGGIVPVSADNQCGEIIAGAQFEAMPAAGAGSGVLPWADSTLRYWNEDGRWSVQVRIPVVSGARNLGDGIDEGIGIAYQASVELAPSGEGFHRWPRDERDEPDRKALACDETTDPAFVNIDPAATTWRQVHILGGGPVGADPSTTDCGGGVSLDWLDIGALDSADNIVSVFNTTPDGTGVVRNTLVARIQNNSPDTIADGAMTARFRIANWGSQVPASEAWTDVPALPFDTDAGARLPAEATNAGFTIPAGTTDRRIRLEWAMTDLQFCQYTHDFASSAAWTAKCEYCDQNNDGDAGPADGVRVIGTTECGAVRGYHQCMSVELRGGNVDYDKRGVARNMDFASLSSDEQVASIDLSGMPAAPGQTEWEVFLLAMPRNVPASVPAGTTGTSMVAANARALMSTIGRSHNLPNMRVPRPIAAIDVGELRKPLPPINGLPEPDQGTFDGYPRNIRGTLVELHRVARIDDGNQIKAEELTVGLTQSFSGATVAQLVPTLDVYVFVRSKEGASALSPLTSFVLVGHHEGALIGMRAGIDGAERISPPPPASASEPPGPRVYRVRVPVGSAVDVRPWMQALVAGEAPRLDDPTWGKPTPPTSDGDNTPCVEPPQGCCRCKKGKKCPPKTSWQLFGEAIPFGLAAVIGGWRSRRRRKTNENKTEK